MLKFELALSVGRPARARNSRISLLGNHLKTEHYIRERLSSVAVNHSTADREHVGSATCSDGDIDVRGLAPFRHIDYRCLGGLGDVRMKRLLVPRSSSAKETVFTLSHGYFVTSSRHTKNPVDTTVIRLNWPLRKSID